MVEDRLSKLFEGFGYSEVVTPGIEFYDLFMGSSRNFQQESLYKLTDSKGRLIVMRPDSTIPIARLASTRLKGAKLPLRLYYNQSIFENNSLAQRTFRRGSSGRYRAYWWRKFQESRLRGAMHCC